MVEGSQGTDENSAKLTLIKECSTKLSLPRPTPTDWNIMDDHFRKAETLFTDGGEQALEEPFVVFCGTSSLYSRVGSQGRWLALSSHRRFYQ